MNAAEIIYTEIGTILEKRFCLYSTVGQKLFGGLAPQSLAMYIDKSTINTLIEHGIDLNDFVTAYYGAICRALPKAGAEAAKIALRVRKEREKKSLSEVED